MKADRVLCCLLALLSGPGAEAANGRSLRTVAASIRLTEKAELAEGCEPGQPCDCNCHCRTGVPNFNPFSIGQPQYPPPPPPGPPPPPPPPPPMPPVPRPAPLSPMSIMEPVEIGKDLPNGGELKPAPPKPPPPPMFHYLPTAPPPGPTTTPEWWASTTTTPKPTTTPEPTTTVTAAPTTTTPMPTTTTAAPTTTVTAAPTLSPEQVLWNKAYGGEAEDAFEEFIQHTKGAGAKPRCGPCMCRQFAALEDAARALPSTKRQATPPAFLSALGH